MHIRNTNKSSGGHFHRSQSKGQIKTQWPPRRGLSGESSKPWREAAGAGRSTETESIPLAGKRSMK